METAELVTTPEAPEIVEIPDLSVKGRIGPGWLCRIKAVIGLPAQRRLAALCFISTVFAIGKKNSAGCRIMICAAKDCACAWPGARR